MRDALEDLLEDDGRMAWWHEHVRLHIVDRGANGDGVLRWLWSWEIPYLTIGRKSADLWRFRAPTLRTGHGLPITVRPDRRLDGDAEDGPWEAVVPADAEDPDERRGIPFRSAVRFEGAELLELNATYKSRWPSMENELKSLQALGFGRNRSRALELTTSRGVDGELARLREREASEVAEVVEVGAAVADGRSYARLISAAVQVKKTRARQERVAREAVAKHARVEDGAERLGKWLHLLVHNALSLALASSADAEVRSMTPATVFDLLLGHAALTCITDGQMTMWVDALAGAADRRRQLALAEALNQSELRCRGAKVVVRVRETTSTKAA